MLFPSLGGYMLSLQGYNEIVCLFACPFLVLGSWGF